MEENIKYLFEDCINSTKDIADIAEQLNKITGPTLCVGCGGSKVVAEFINLVLTKKNKIICKTIDARDINHIDLSLYENIVAVSYSGNNFGIKSVLQNNKKKYLLTSRRTNIFDETLLNYQMEHRHSFISINSTLVPMAIILKYYLGNAFNDMIKYIFACIDEALILNNIDNVNIITGIDTFTPTLYLESTLVEAGITNPTIHFKYDYCHGRSTINKNINKSAIYLENGECDLDILLKEAFLLRTNEMVLIRGLSKDEVINNFYMTLQVIYLLMNIAKKKNIDLSNIKYDKEIVKKVYYFKGSM